MACDLQVDMEGETKSYTRKNLKVELSEAPEENQAITINDATTISPANLAGLCRGMLGSFKTKTRGVSLLDCSDSPNLSAGRPVRLITPPTPRVRFLKYNASISLYYRSRANLFLKTELPYFLCHDPRRHGD